MKIKFKIQPKLNGKLLHVPLLYFGYDFENKVLMVTILGISIIFEFKANRNENK